MISYTYQIQLFSRGKWIPYYKYGSSVPAEFTDLDLAHDCLYMLHSKHSDCRIVKIEVYNILTLN